jgi:AbrB family looped-hinge helix DNA binding protein
MSGQDTENCGCATSDMTSDCCQVEALVTVDRKGQILLPKDLREKQDIKEGDKFAVINVASKGNTCCLILMKANMFEPMVKDALSPVMKIIVKSDGE